MEPTQMERLAGYKLIESGSLVAFDITETQIEPSPNGEDISVQIELHLGEQEEEDYRSDDHEWVASDSSFVSQSCRFVTLVLVAYRVWISKKPILSRSWTSSIISDSQVVNCAATSTTSEDDA